MMKILPTKSVIKSFLITACAFTISGCSINTPSFGPTNLRNKITVAQTVERLELYVRPQGLQLSARDRDAMGGFIQGYARSGEGPIYVNMPVGPAYGGPGMGKAHGELMYNFASSGIDSGKIQTGQYRGVPNGAAPIVISYRRLSAELANCHQGASLLTTEANQPYPNFGCSQTANLAAMIDDPRQFLSPYEMAPANGARRQLVLEKYSKGQETGAPRPANQVISADGG